MTSPYKLSKDELEIIRNTGGFAAWMLTFKFDECVRDIKLSIQKLFDVS